MNHQHQRQDQQPAQASCKASGELQQPTVGEAAFAWPVVEDEDEDAVIARALAILEGRLQRPGFSIDSPATCKHYLRMRLAGLDHEQFHVMFLDVKNRLIKCEAMFIGTLTCTSVHPREVLKAALRHNAASVILAHNHPSGVSEPSEADLRLTETLKQGLALVDVRVLDHIVVAGSETHSFAEHGQL